MIQKTIQAVNSFRLYHLIEAEKYAIFWKQGIFLRFFPFLMAYLVLLFKKLLISSRAWFPEMTPKKAPRYDRGAIQLKDQ